MASGAASEAELGRLHNNVAKVMHNALTVLDVAQEQYIENPDAFMGVPPVINASLLGVMTKFLSDNSITAAPDDSQNVSELEAKIEERRRKRSVSTVVPFVGVG